MHNDGEDPAQWQARADCLKAKWGNGNGAGMPLAVAVKLSTWPTPTTSDAGHSPSPSEMRRNTPRISAEVVKWATPTTHDCKGGASAKGYAGSLTSQAGKSITPEWVECLMGFPSGWTLTDGPQVVAKPSASGSRRASVKRPKAGARG
jgi:hypothetical protein